MLGEEGPVHPCCVRWMEDAGLADCPACRGSDGRFGRTAPAKPKSKPAKLTPLARRDDPESSQIGARAIEPVRGGRKELVLARLRQSGGDWVNGNDLIVPEVGGTEGLRRLRELVKDGWAIKKRPNPLSATAWQYRLDEIE